MILSNHSMKSDSRRYYVHYDGMDRRLDEWVRRERFLERANPVTPSVLVIFLQLLKSIYLLWFH